MHDSTTPARRSRLRGLLATRGRRITAAVVALSLVGAAGAAAAFVARAPISGGGKSGTFALGWGMTGTPTVAAGSISSTKPTLPANFGEALVLPTSSLTFFPGSFYEFSHVVVSASGNAPGWVTGVTLPGLPAGYTAEITTGCGASVVAGSPVTVGVRITADESLAADGAAWTLSGGGGVEATPKAQMPTAPATCAPFVGGSL